MNNEVKLKGLAGLAQLLSPGADWAYDNAARCVRDYVKEQTLELAAKDVAIEKLRDNIGGLIGENNDYMERCAEKDARLDVLQRAVEWMRKAFSVQPTEVPEEFKAIICPGSGKGE